MKLRGEQLRPATTQVVKLPRPDGTEWCFTVQPLPLGFHRRLRDRGLNPPAAPTRVVRDSSGRPIRDDTGAVVTSTDAADPQFLCELETYHQRVAVLAVAEALRADAAVTFETAAPAANAPALDWLRYADALHAELESAGFAAGDLILLCNHICRLSNLLSDHLQQGRANFSSPQIATPP
jgi:hypothetical protein